MLVGEHPKACAVHRSGGYGICDCGLQHETTSEGLIQHDLAQIMDELGLGTYARPMSPHMVVHDVILPRIRRLMR